MSDDPEKDANVHDGPEEPETVGPPDNWKDDPRVAFSQATGKWIFEDEKTGVEYEFDDELRQWLPVPGKNDIESQQRAYESKEIKRKEPILQEEGADSNVERRAAKKTKTEVSKEKDNKEPTKEPRKSTAIYVSNLPNDVTVEELRDVFSKYGVITEDLTTGEPKIKLYLDDNGKPKGDALIVYFRPESVELAIEMMDRAAIRAGGPGVDGGLIRVEKAQFSNDKRSDAEPRTTDAKSKARIQRKLQKLNDKLVDWDDDEPKQVSKRWEKMVVLKHVFTIDELEKDVSAALDIKDDMLQGCEEIGPVQSVTLYDQEADGIVVVKFQDADDALTCIDVMNGRYFDGRKLEVSAYDGRRYRRATKAADGTDEAEARRLDEFGKWLETKPTDASD